MESIYRCSAYGFLEIEETCETDKADIELAASCVSGVYGASFIASQGRLHIIFNPKKTSLHEISCSLFWPIIYIKHIEENRIT